MESDGPPTQGRALVWFCALMLGVGQLYPWNAYLSATSYFVAQFAPFPYSFAMPIAFNWANIFTLFLMNFYAQRFSVRLRLQLGHFLGFAMLVLVPLINIIPLPALTPPLRIAVCLAATFVSGFTTALLIGTAFGALATLPPSYTTALMAGQGLGGIMTAALGMLLQFGIFPNPSSTETNMSGVIFFASAALVMLLAAVLTETLLRAPFYLHYQRRADKSIQNFAEQESGLGSEDALLLPQEGPVTLKAVFKKIWPDAVGVFSVFFVTLALFPGFTVMIPNYDIRLAITATTSNLPLILISLFQVMDLVGRFLPQLVVIVPKRWLLAPVLVRFGFFALWMLMVYTKVFGATNIWAYVFMIIFALTNGYLSTLAMIFGPSRVQPKEQPAAGTLMSFFLQFGIFIGVHFAMILLLAIEGPGAVVG